MNHITDEEALSYHSRGRKGKLQVVPTKPTATQEDLSLAYTPGVAVPCRRIAENPLSAYDYTARGNLVAVVSNGTAVLGLGDIGPLASKPVMEGKAVLFKRFADIDVFDLEVDATDPEAFIAVVKALEPTFGGINLEDIRGPECFEIERRLKEEMRIPVFHDDQHGTAIISAAALLNALELAGKNIGDVRIVVSGAGAAAIACRALYVRLGADPAKIVVCDSTGPIFEGRENRMTDVKRAVAAPTEARTLAEAMRGADVFIGLSVAGLVDGDMVRSMADDPIVFAMANPDPEISWDEATAARSDVLMATGRSDYPNQVNNVLGFPFLFRGALDVRATDITEGMKLAAVRALAELAREDIPDAVLKAYGLRELSFGREYLIPKPFDSRVLLRVVPAVARTAIDEGVAQMPIEDWDAYQRHLETLISRRLELMHGIFDQARRSPRRIVFAEGEHDKILRAVRVVVDRGIARPILLARPDAVRERLRTLGLAEGDVEIVDPQTSAKADDYARRLHEQRRREGVTLVDARRQIANRNYWAAMMVEAGDADGMLSGLSGHYNETIRPALRVTGVRAGVTRVSGAYLLIFRDRLFFLADTTVNIDPSAEELAEIALLVADFARRFQIVPRVAMLSFSNFGSNSHPVARKVRRATEIVHEREPDLMIDGEMQASAAVVRSILREEHAWSRLTEPANVLVFPELQSANIAYQLLWRLADAEAIGPILLGMGRPVHVLQRGVEVNDIVNMAAICAVDAQERDGVPAPDPGPR